MIALCIIFIVLGLILYLPICIDVKYIGGEFSYKITYAFIKFYPKDTKPKKKTSKPKDNKENYKDKTSSVDSPKSKTSHDDSLKKTSQDKENVSKEDTSNDSESSDLNALDTLNVALDIFKAIKTKLGKFITSIKITNLYINFQVADLDAFDCALKFGKLNIVLGNILGFLYWNFKVKKKSINIQPKFNSSNSIYDVSFKVKMGLGKGVGKILVMIFKVIPILKRNDLL